MGAGGWIIATMGCGVVACGAEPAPDDGSATIPSPTVPQPTTTDTDKPTPPLTCGADSPNALGACVEQSRFEADLASLEGPRAPGDPKHAEARALCADRFAALGDEVELQRSDHAPFWEQGFPALHMTDTSEFRYGAYHCREGDDVKENLDPAFATGVVQGTVAATAELLGLVGT